MKSILVVALLAGIATPALAADRLPDTVAPIAYDIAIVPNARAMTFGGTETVRVAVLRPTATIVLNAADLRFSQVTVDGHTAPYALNAADQQLTITLPRAVGPGEHVLHFAWTGRINTTAAGLFAIDYTNADGSLSRMLATQFEAPDARRFAPMWDEPAFKARFTLSVTVPGDQNAYSNMPAVSMTPQRDGSKLYRFRQSPLMSSYLLFLGLGDLERRTAMAGPTEIGIITRHGVADRGDYALAQARRILAYYNDYFGQPYPLPKLDMIAAPGSSQFFGAMENWGAIFYFENEVLIDPARTDQSGRERVFTTIAHEMAHQWFGDLVTMRWWTDLWLNEGFASWMESRATADLNPEWQAGAADVSGSRETAFQADATAATHPIIRPVETVDQLNEAFDGITYSKGEAVIRMLETTLGRDAFRDGVRRYMARYRYTNTVTDQLWAELSAAAGRPVEQIANDFTLQGGVPLITVSGATCSGGRTTATMAQGRFAIDAASRHPQTWHVPLALGIVGQPVTELVVAGAAPQTATVTGCGTLVLNRDKGSYLRVRYDDASHAAIVRDFARLTLNDQLGTIEDDFALAQSGDQGLGRYLADQGAVAPDAEPLLWSAVADKFDTLFELYGRGPLAAPLGARAIALLSPILARLGTAASPGESTQTVNLRVHLLATLGTARDPAVVAAARRYVARLAQDPAAIPAPIRVATLATYAYNATPAEWDALRSLAMAERDPVARNRYFEYLGEVRDDALAARALALLSGSDLTDPQKASLLSSVANLHPDLAFDYAVAHLALVNGFLEESARSGYVVELAEGSDDAAMTGKITAFANANLPAASRQPAVQTIARIAARHASADRMRGELSAWLGQAG